MGAYYESLIFFGKLGFFYLPALRVLNPINSEARKPGNFLSMWAGCLPKAGKPSPRSLRALRVKNLGLRKSGPFCLRAYPSHPRKIRLDGRGCSRTGYGTDSLPAAQPR